jgi:hypothetical protein
MTNEHHADRRSFLRTGAIAGTALVAGASAMAQQVAAETDASNRPLTKGDIAILRFLSAVEQIESDLEISRYSTSVLTASCALAISSG